MSYNTTWEKIMLENLRKQSYKDKSSAQAMHNAQYGSGTTQSGQYTSAAEGIARAEGAQAAGISEIAAETARQEAEERRRYEQNRKDAQSAQKWGVITNIASTFAPPLIGAGINLLKGSQATPGQQQAAAAPASLTSQMAARQTPSFALDRIRQGNPNESELERLLLQAGINLKKKPNGYMQTQNPNLYGNWNFPQGTSSYSGS